MKEILLVDINGITLSCKRNQFDESIRFIVNSNYSKLVHATPELSKFYIKDNSYDKSALHPDSKASKKARDLMLEIISRISYERDVNE